MEKKPVISTRRLVLTGMLAALTAAGSAIRVTLPLSIAGTTSFHLGNIMCSLAGMLLGPWLGGLASGIGSAIYDCMNPAYIADSWITFLTKGAIGLLTGLVISIGREKDWGYVKATLAAAAGSVAYALLYFAKTYFYTGLFKHDLTPEAAWLTVIGKVPATVFNAVVAIIFAPILGLAIKKALKRSHLEF